jgi:hypothetical protein
LRVLRLFAANDSAMNALPWTIYLSFVGAPPQLLTRLFNPLITAWAGHLTLP